MDGSANLLAADVLMQVSSLVSLRLLSKVKFTHQMWLPYLGHAYRLLEAFNVCVSISQDFLRANDM